MTIITTAIAPITIDENELIAETPVIDFAMFLKRRCAPRVNDSSSRFSAV
jgi:hypothetical protein